MSIQVDLLHTFTGHDGPVYALEHANDSENFFSGSGDKLVSSWNLDPAIPPTALINVGAIVYSVCNVPEKNIILIGESNGGLHVVDRVEKKEVRFINHHQGGIFDIKYSLENRHVYTGSADGSFAVWSLDDFSLLKSYKLCKEKIRNIAINADETNVAIACGDGSIRIFNSVSMTMDQQYSAHALSTNCLRYHPVQNVLVSGGRDAMLNFWDTTSYKLIKSIPAHNYAVYSIDFSMDAAFIATASRDKTVKIWDATNLDFLVRIDRESFSGHAFSVNKVLWLKERNLLLSGGDDKNIKLWSVSSGMP
ncbi:MAG: WD40 repeat domain-containing protein [Bacteroidetes bacterium]|nr:MAG: WD40 repeat domain-containing protein [Bacteroidota bacterium]